MAKRLAKLDKNFAAQAVSGDDRLKWISARECCFTVNGLAWFEENDREFLRLPKRARGVVRDPVWELGTIPSGGRVRFKTDSTTLRLRIRHGRPDTAMPHMCAVGVSGMDLYEGPPRRMVYWGSNKEIAAQKTYVSSYFEDLPRKQREFTFYLPTYNDLVELDVGLDADATIAPPTRFQPARPIVFYGTSITQGGCSSRSGAGYVARVGRTLGADVINLGFSGNGQCEPEVAELVGDIDARCYVNDSVGNMTIERMETRYAAFNESLRARRPRVPLLLMTCIRFARERYDAESRKAMAAKNAVVLRTWREFRRRGDTQVHLLDCREVVGLSDDHPSVDGVHLTDLGFQWMAEAVAAALRNVLSPAAKRP